LDWTTRKERNAEAYCIDNSIRKANDLAFQTAIVNLFQELHSWNQSSRSRLRTWVFEDVEVSMRQNHILKTGMSPVNTFGIIKMTAGFRPPPYRARFLNDTPDLTSVPCIEKLSFINENWPGGTLKSRPPELHS
jgi:hypothetical protein